MSSRFRVLAPLCLVFAAVAYLQGCSGPSESAAVAPVEERAKEVFGLLAAQDFAAVYSRCSPAFREEIDQERFIASMGMFASFMGGASEFGKAEILGVTMHESGDSCLVAYKLPDREKQMEQRWVLVDGVWYWEKGRAGM